MNIASSKQHNPQDDGAGSKNDPQFSQSSSVSGAIALEKKALQRAREVFAERSSIFTSEYQSLLRLLRQARQDTGLTQVQLGERLGQPQAIISKCERGERRLDVIELKAYCTALGVSYLQLLEKLEIDLVENPS